MHEIELTRLKLELDLLLSLREQRLNTLLPAGPPTVDGLIL